MFFRNEVLNKYAIPGQRCSSVAFQPGLHFWARPLLPRNLNLVVVCGNHDSKAVQNEAVEHEADCAVQRVARTNL